MADSRRFGLPPQTNIEQILLEAQQRWLRPAEICEILQNYQSFRISPEPPNKPPSGSLFLFDRKVLRYFRKDGHNWRKKKDGKTVKEAHERLKAGSVDVLHCYYAHGEENENFQRRSYWLLEENFMHIVLVHYLEVKGSKASYNRSRDVEENIQVANMDSPVCSNSFASQSQPPSQSTDVGSPESTETSEYRDAESAKEKFGAADNYQARAGYYPFPELQQYEYGSLMDAPLFNDYHSTPSIGNQGDQQGLHGGTHESDVYSVAQEDITKVFDETGLGLTFNEFRSRIDLASWDEVLEHCTTGFQDASFQPPASMKAATMEDNCQRESFTLGELFSDDSSHSTIKQEDIDSLRCNSSWQLSDAVPGSLVTTNIDVENDLTIEGRINYPSLAKHQPRDLSNIQGKALVKYDSFSRWMCRELGEVVDDSYRKTNSDVYWSTVENECIIDDLLSPSLSQEQLFSIIDFSPNWAYTNVETKVLITGTFLKNKDNAGKCNWSCMFGEVEVPAEILADGTLCCHAPPRKSGRIPFYITCSNRLACSEVREFEYRDDHAQYTSDPYIRSTHEMNLHIRLEKLLSLGCYGQLKHVNLSCKIRSLMMEVDDESFNISKLMQEKGFAFDSTRDQLIEKLLKEKLHTWLLHKVAEENKGPILLDEEGQGVIHLAAALGYDWAIEPTITAGVKVNFRDTRGWTALHWAAYCGREHTVGTLITLGADPGALTDPTPEFPSGRTPADLASANGHKGIAGFLAESSLTNHLSALTLGSPTVSELAEHPNVSGIEVVSEGTTAHIADRDTQAGLSLKDSLSAVRNATQAAARIYQVFRVHSFHRKKLVEYGDHKCGMSDEHALSLVSIKSTKPGHNDMPVQTAAVKIQNKFRGWKGRKEFLIVRQRIVKIQAHIRGHQVRKHYGKIVWTVGVLEKVVLRWRRKGTGLRGFRSEGLLEAPNIKDDPSNEDEYDFLQEGRKQTEARLEKALARVKSMVQYPEARDQYRRLLTVVTELEKSKEMSLKESEEAAEDDFMVEVEELLQDDMLMPIAW